MATGDLQARVAVPSGFSHLTSSGPDEMASIDVFSIVAPTEGKVSMTDRTRPRLLAVSQIPPDLRAVLSQRYELADHAALAGGPAPGFDIAVTMSMHGVNAAQMDSLPDLKLIACNGAGLERIDLAEARRRGIAVCHTPDELAEDVADGAIALTYAIMRRVVEADRFVRAGRSPARRWGSSAWAGSDAWLRGVPSPSGCGCSISGASRRPTWRIHSSRTCWSWPGRPTC
jgi:hypothetical protein